MVGTCSWTDRALVTSGWYPPGSRDAEGRLRHYAARFPVVEVDSSYYALPSARNSRLWAERTPDGFRFDVKAFAPLTGHPVTVGALPPGLRPAGPLTARLRPGDLPPDVVAELWDLFDAGLEPLREAGRLGAVLFQFPPWFAPGGPAYDRLAECRARCGDTMAVEFRHPGWFAPDRLPEAVDFLKARDIAFTAVDTVQGLPRSLPPVAPVTSDGLALVRLHGRSPEWGTGSKEDRFRHRYTPEELVPWADRVRRMTEQAERVHVLFNNCCADAAVSAAALMTELLAEDHPG
ncbi:DUF72 domain-containing protein [Streptomyces sp. LP05-1]|uniref:DUF72 domain-containing protein n=1 Tax=Streptomyces pyxinae TaxID=2970734 RepID=A0ABT2CH73_9ACTN|nr:DUF72 domain-containing protein [Streptomyces sp. LP05-1]